MRFTSKLKKINEYLQYKLIWQIKSLNICETIHATTIITILIIPNREITVDILSAVEEIFKAVKYLLLFCGS